MIQEVPSYLKFYPHSWPLLHPLCSDSPLVLFLTTDYCYFLPVFASACPLVIALSLVSLDVMVLFLVVSGVMPDIYKDLLVARTRRTPRESLDLLQSLTVNLFVFLV
jgi:hypothetical protein